MKKLISLSSIIVVLLLACGPNEKLALQTVAYQTAIAIVHKTETAKAPTATRNPTSTLIPLSTTTKTPTATKILTTTALAIRGSDYFYNGISFTVDPVLGDEVFIKQNPESPRFIEFSFAIEGLCREVGCVTVYQVQQFREYPFGDAIMDNLQEAIETGSTLFIPTWGAAIIMRAQTQQLRFQNGTGIRALVERGQAGYFVNNEALVYDFHGLTDDGQYYIYVSYPLDAPMLLSTYDPEENTNEGAIPVPALPDDDPFGLMLNEIMGEYNQEAQRQLVALEGARFTPDLGLLDALVHSILVTSSSGE